MSKQFKQSNKHYANINDLFVAYFNPFQISQTDFSLIVKTFFLALIKSVVREGKIYQFPYGLGSFGVKKRPTHGRGSFDYALFNKEGIKV